MISLWMSQYQKAVIDTSVLVEAPLGQAAFRREEREDDCHWDEGAEQITQRHWRPE